MKIIVISLVLLLSFPAKAGREILPGPIRAEVIQVIDGDTLRVRTKIWLGQTVTTLLRIDGVDTPELRGKCPAETELAISARDFLVNLIHDKVVVLQNVRYGKYAGRVVARVLYSEDKDVSDLLINKGLGRPYNGNRRKGWCS